MESPLEVLSRVAFMVNKTMPPPGDYGIPHKYGSQLGRFTCWRAKDLAEVKRAEQSDVRRTAVGSSRRGGGGPFLAPTASAVDLRRRDGDVVAVDDGGSKLVHSERNAGSHDHRRTEDATLLHHSLSEDLGRLGGRSREAIVGCADSTRVTSDRQGKPDFGLIFLPRSPTVGSDDVQSIVDDDVEPLNLSVRRRESTSPVRQCSTEGTVNASRRTGTFSAADPEVEEHFRRSLEQRYPKGEPAQNGSVGVRSHIAASVEEHFLKSLGSSWFSPADRKASAMADGEHVGVDNSTASSAALLASRGGSPPASLKYYSRDVSATCVNPVRQMTTVEGRKRNRIPTADRSPSRDGCKPKATTAVHVTQMASRGEVKEAAPAEHCSSNDEGEFWSPVAKRRCPREERPSAVGSPQSSYSAGVSETSATSPAPKSPAAASSAAISAAASPAAASPVAASPAAAIGIACEAKSYSDEVTFPERRQSPVTPVAALPDSTIVGGCNDGVGPRPSSGSGHAGQAADRSPSPPGGATSVTEAAAMPCVAADAASVDEHFAKALGSKWAEIKRHLSAPPQSAARCERF